MVGIPIFLWDGLSSGAKLLLVSGSVNARSSWVATVNKGASQQIPITHHLTTKSPWPMKHRIKQLNVWICVSKKNRCVGGSASHPFHWGDCGSWTRGAYPFGVAWWQPRWWKMTSWWRVTVNSPWSHSPIQNPKKGHKLAEVLLIYRSWVSDSATSGSVPNMIKNSLKLT